jgi:hypothetical protein
MERVLFWLMWVPGLWLLFPLWLRFASVEQLDNCLIDRVVSLHAYYSSFQLMAQLCLAARLVGA